MKATIKEFANGKFQVWFGDNVLRPCKLELLGAHQSYHEFMYVDSEEKAIELAKKWKEYNDSITVVQQKEIEL